MKTFIRLAIVSAFIVLSGNSFGQVPSDSLARSGQRVQLDSSGAVRPEHYRKALRLDSAEASRFAAVVDTYRAKLQVIMQDSSVALNTRQEQMRTLVKERNQKLRELLSQRQKQQ